MCASRTFFKTDGHYSTKMWLACSMQHTRIALQPFNCIIDSAENIVCGVTTKTKIVDTKLFAKEPICNRQKRYHKSPWKSLLHPSISYCWQHCLPMNAMPPVFAAVPIVSSHSHWLLGLNHPATWRTWYVFHLFTSCTAIVTLSGAKLSNLHLLLPFFFAYCLFLRRTDSI